MADPVAIRDAATVVLVRDGSHVLMGQRGKAAAFMPSKFVFPGGALDSADQKVPMARPMTPETESRLRKESAADISHGLAIAAIREMWEEAGLRLAIRAPEAPELPQDWAGFSAGGWRPDASALRFFFRAITPPGRPRRFDARFFMVEANSVMGDLDDFSEADDELAHLHWVSLQDARRLDLPFITTVVLAEVEARLAADAAPPFCVPFFHMSDGQPMAIDLA